MNKQKGKSVYFSPEPHLYDRRPESGDRPSQGSRQRGVTFNEELTETMEPRLEQYNDRGSSPRIIDLQSNLQRISSMPVTQLTSPKKSKQLSNMKLKQLSLPMHKTSSQFLSRKRKRTLSQNKPNLTPVAASAHAEGPLTPKNFFSTIEDKERPVIQDEVGVAPARELETVWSGFIEESRRRHSVNTIIKSLYRYPHLDRLTVLNLERHGLERIFEYLEPCKNLIALYLKQNRVITRDLVLIQHLTTLRTVDLSSNKIHFLPDKEHLAKLQNLQYLQLHQNEIVGNVQLKNLTCLQELRHMTLQGNPCSKVKGYRQLLVDAMPQLRSLDAFIVMDYERQDIAKMFPPENIKKHKLLELKRFRPFNKDYNYWTHKKYIISEAIQVKLQNLDSDSCEKEETTSKQQKSQRTLIGDDFQLTTNPIGINNHLKAVMYDLRRKFEYCSPILTIQKTVKKWIYRKKYLKKRKLTALLVWGLNRWHKRYWIERMIRGLSLNRGLLYQLGRVRFIQAVTRKLIRQWRIMEQIANRGQSIWRMKRAQDRSFKYAFSLSKYKSMNTERKLLFRKSQFDLITRIGLTKFAKRARISQDFGVRSDVEIDSMKFRRSLIINMVVCSYRHTRVLRARNIFSQIVELTKQSTQQFAVKGQYLAEFDKETIDTLPVKSGKNPTYDDEKVLYELSYGNDYDFLSTIESIASYNRRHHTIIQVFYEPFMRRLQALIKIQHWYIAILWKRKQKPIFTQREDGTKVLATSLVGRDIRSDNSLQVHFILLERIAKRFQRVWRKRCLIMRINSLSKIAQYVAEIDSNEVYIEQTTYLNLQKAFSDAMGAKWHKNTKIRSQRPGSRQSKKLSKKLTTVLSKENGEDIGDQSTNHANEFESFFDRRFRFEVSGKDQELHISYTNKVDKMGRYSKSNLPLWFQEKTHTEIPKIAMNKRRSTFQNNIMALIHMTSSLRKDDAPRVMNLSELEGLSGIVDPDHAQTKLVTIKFQTVKEARNRAIAIALLTTDVRRSSDKFIRVFTAGDFSAEKSEQTYQQLKESLIMYNLEDKDSCNTLTASQITLSQQHSGIVRKREEPYRTLLRAKPKDKKKQLERFIVLGDADPKDIEERLGSELISHQVMGHLNSKDKVGNSRGSTAPFSEVKSPKEYLVPRKKRGSVSKPSTNMVNCDDWDKQRKSDRKIRNSMTQGQMAQMKHQQTKNHDKIYKVKALQRKLNFVKQRIDENTEIDPLFKQLFVHSMIPMLKTHDIAKQVKKEDDVKVKEVCLARVFEMQRTDMDYEDPAVVCSLSDEKIEHKIQDLFLDYRNHKKAYRQASSLSTKREQLRTLNSFSPINSGSPTSPNEQSHFPGQSTSPIRATIRHRGSRSQLNSKDRKSSTKMNIVEQTRSDQDLPDVGVAQSARLSHAAPHLNLTLNKFLESRDGKQNRMIEDFSLGIKSHRVKRLTIGKISRNKQMSQTYIELKKEKHRDFFNQSNKLNDMTLKSRKDPTKITKQASLQDAMLKIRTLQSYIPERKSLPEATNKLMSIPFKIDKAISPQRIAPLQDRRFKKEQNRTAEHIQSSVKRKMELTLKVTNFSRLVGQENDILSSQESKRSSQSRSKNRYMSKEKDPLLLTQQQSVMTVQSPKQPPIVYEAGQGQQRKSWLVPDLMRKSESSNNKINPLMTYRIPLYCIGKKSTKSGQAPINVLMKTSESVKTLKPPTVYANLKTKAIISDIAASTSKSRDILQFQKTVNMKSGGLLTERLTRNNEARLFTQSVQQNKMLALMQTKNKEKTETTATKGYRPHVLIPQKLQVGHFNRQRNFGVKTTIETIMRTRKEQEESQRSILMVGANQINQDYDDYIRGDIKSSRLSNNQSLLNSQEKARAVDQLMTMQTTSAIGFSQEKRTRSTLQFANQNSNSNRRKLSILPPLRKPSQGQSMGKFMSLK